MNQFRKYVEDIRVIGYFCVIKYWKKPTGTEKKESTTLLLPKILPLQIMATIQLSSKPTSSCCKPNNIDSRLILVFV